MLNLLIGTVRICDFMILSSNNNHLVAEKKERQQTCFSFMGLTSLFFWTAAHLRLFYTVLSPLRLTWAGLKKRETDGSNTAATCATH